MTDETPTDAGDPDTIETAAIRVPSRFDESEMATGEVRINDDPSTGADAPLTTERPAEDPGSSVTPRPGGSDLDLIMAARLQAQHSAGPMVLGAPGGAIPGYSILQELHRGGQGVVYKARQEGTRREVAIKVMLNGGFASPHDRVRFEREIQVLAQLNHPNIVGIHDSGQAGENFYYVMNFVNGPTLDRFVLDRRMSIREVLELFVVVCHAVNAAHLRGVIHRDLKPSNIRVTPEGSPQILDFGLAKVEEVGDAGVTLPTQMTRTGQFIGSLPWASPEQARGDSTKIDVRTDVYALGVMLFQLLCERFPYPIDVPMRDALDNIISREPDRPRSLNRKIDAEVEAVVLKSLEKHRERRYQSAGELARDLERYLRGEAVEARRWNKRYVMLKFLRRNWAVAVPAAVVVAAAVGAAGWFTSFSLNQDVQDHDAALQLRVLEERAGQLRRRNAVITAELAATKADNEALRSRVQELEEYLRIQRSGLLEDDAGPSPGSDLAGDG
jgi:serine/threonine protein kinase